jgi:uncharacterized protein YneF (UPF0154 family)
MKDKLEQRIQELQGQFDLMEPEAGHFDRFRSRMEEAPNRKPSVRRLVATLAIAASLLLFGGVWIGYFISSQGMELSQVSTEMAETESYFIATIERELQALEDQRDTDTEQIISDALSQMKRLEDHYDTLRIELQENPDNEQIIHAMIANFQSRITLLQDVLNQIEQHKELKNPNHENYV